jgi:hypothetical protein
MLLTAYVSAELPDPETEPELFEVVTKFIIHGKCGPQYPNAPCMRDGKCSKKYSRIYDC